MSEKRELSQKQREALAKGRKKLRNKQKRGKWSKTPKEYHPKKKKP